MSEFGRKFDSVQARHDNAEPPSDRDCGQEGHAWRTVRVAVQTVKGEYVCFVDRVCDVCGETKSFER